LLRRLAIDADEGGAEQAENAESHGGSRTEAAQQAESGGDRGADQGKAEQHRDAAPDRAAGIAQANEQCGEGRFAQGRKVDVLACRDDDRHGQAGADALSQADRLSVDADRQPPEVGCAAHGSIWHAALLPPLPEEVSQQRGGFGFADAADDFGTVVAGGRLEDARTMVNAAAFGIVGAEDQAADAEQADRLRAHGAWLQRDDQVAVG